MNWQGFLNRENKAAEESSQLPGTETSKEELEAFWTPSGVFIQFWESPSTPLPVPGKAKVEEAVAEEDGLLPWWVLGLLLFGFGDTFTSVMVFNRGGVEANPLFGFLIRHLGNNIASFVIVKSLLLVALIFLSYLGLPARSRWIVPLLLIGAGTLLTVRNLFVLFSL